MRPSQVVCYQYKNCKTDLCKMAHTACSIIINAPLCFVFSKYNKISNAQIVGILTDYYTEKDITTAKNQLIEDFQRLQPDLSMSQLRSRRNADLRVRQHTEAADIVDIVSAIDQRGLTSRLPVYVVNNTDFIPTLKLEDGELRYFLLKVAKMEEAILVLQRTVNKLYSCVCKAAADNNSTSAGLSSDVSAQTGHTAGQVLLITPANTTTCQPSIQRQHNSNTANCVDVSPVTQATHSTVSVNSQLTTDVGAVGGEAYTVHQGRWANCPPSTSASSAVETDDAAEGHHNDDFMIVQSRRVKRRRVRRSSDSVISGQHSNVPPANEPSQPEKSSSYAAVVQKSSRKPLVVGSLRSPPPLSSTSTTNQAVSVYACGKRLTAAKPFFGKAVFCVDNVSNDVSAPDLEQFVKQMGVRVLACNDTKPRRSYWQKVNGVVPADRKAFYLCINKADTKLLLNSSKWPADVSVSTWFFRKKDEHQETVIAPSPSTAAATIAAAALSQSAFIESDAAVAITAATAGTDTFDAYLATALAAVSAEVDTEPMNLSPIVNTICRDKSSDGLVEVSESLLEDAHNSTTVHVVDLSNVTLH
jgi:hypothetical protein